MPSEARACAHRVLRRVFEQGAYADRALQAGARGLAARDRALAMRLSYGAVQRAATLDYAIERLSGRALSALDPPVLAALRVGLYELLFSDRAPDHAVIDDAVELVKGAGSHGHGLVNAVLRRAARERSALLSDLDDSTPEGAAVLHSHPRWLAEMWWRQLGPQRTRSLMAADNEPAELAVRVNTLVAEAGAVVAALAELRPRREQALLGIPLPEAIVLDEPFDVGGSELFAAGAILPQSRAAMLVSHVLDPQPGERVLDLCAAPGGKSTHIAALMEGRGEIVAVECNPARASQLRAALTRTQAASVAVEVGDASIPRGAGETFDRVLVDAPCSGLGTLQARPDLRWRASPERMRELAALQAKILAAAGEAVRAGGTLVYSTCTISAAENEQQIERFLDSRPDFAIERLGSSLEASSKPFLTSLPDRDRSAGFFVAKLRRR